MLQGFRSRVVWATAAAIAAMVLLLVGVAFLGVALYLWLVSLTVAPPLAALVVGIAAITLALLVVLLARLKSGRRAAEGADAAAELGETIGREAASLARAHPYKAFAIALAAGFAAGAGRRANSSRRTRD